MREVEECSQQQCLVGRVGEYAAELDDRAPPGELVRDHPVDAVK